MSQALDELRRHRLKVTPQRLSILEAVLRSHDHPTADALYTRLKGDNPTLSLATVYKTLEVFRQMGLVNELGFADGSARYDPNVAPHINLVCLKCGNIQDMPAGKALELRIRKLRKEGRFRVINQRFEFYGYCKDCGP